MLVLVIALVTLKTIGGNAYEPLEEIGYLVFSIRYGFQLYRVVSLVWRSKELRQMQKLGEINLSNIDIVD